MDKETTRSLPVQLSDAEVADRVRKAKEQTDEIALLGERLAKLAEDTKAAKADVDSKHREVKRLVRIADARQEDREVVCLWSYDLPTNTATLVRTDTGEFVQARPVTDEERRELEQRPLEFEGGEGDKPTKRRTN